MTDRLGLYKLKNDNIAELQYYHVQFAKSSSMKHHIPKIVTIHDGRVFDMIT